MLASLSGGPATGATAGLIATLLYEAALRANGVGNLAASAGVHLVAYVAAGTIVGYFARRARGMLADALNLLEQMLHVARHDVAAGALSSSGLETAISRRIAEDELFGLLLCELSGGDDLVQTAQRAIEYCTSRNGETSWSAASAPPSSRSSSRQHRPRRSSARRRNWNSFSSGTAAGRCSAGLHGPPKATTPCRSAAQRANGSTPVASRRASSPQLRSSATNVIATGVPAGASLKSRLMSELKSRTQPCEAASPINVGSFVPWMPIGPPWTQFLSTVEWAEMPSAATPNGPLGLASTKRSFTK